MCLENEPVGKRSSNHVFISDVTLHTACKVRFFIDIIEFFLISVLIFDLYMPSHMLLPSVIAVNKTAENAFEEELQSSFAKR